MYAELVADHGTRGLLHQFAQHFTAGNRRLPDMLLATTQKRKFLNRLSFSSAPVSHAVTSGLSSVGSRIEFRIQ